MSGWSETNQGCTQAEVVTDNEETTPMPVFSCPVSVYFHNKHNVNSKKKYRTYGPVCLCVNLFFVYMFVYVSVTKNQTVIGGAESSY